MPKSAPSPAVSDAQIFAAPDAEKRFAVAIDDPELTFNASHFVGFPLPDDDPDVKPSRRRWIGEPIHGHDFRPIFRLEGPLDAAGCVVDFLLAKSAARATVDAWRHKLVLPTRLPGLSVSALESKRFGKTLDIYWRGEPAWRHWVYPADDVVFLDATNASAELIAAAALD
ncbi:MAG: 6-carboxytetrahydropterin synthase, partial [Thermoguttaceae bacterium]|nr:6-carboxytetrahydropterin synthase [Thermoguttaceae bacterium]